MRIVGGSWAGTPLTSPAGRVRPTAEDVRGAWLGALERELQDARLLELYAGSGAVGLEALSRGAATCDFVENNPAALHALKANVARMRARDRTRIFRRDALLFAAGLEAGRYDIAFADPPYHSRQLDRLIRAWLDSPFSPILTVEHATDHAVPGGGLRSVFGETSITTYGV
jgi:16S rRNA (guanine966-N2)-methyltransferase